MYLYRCELVRVIDGDTVVLDIDLGLHIWQRGVKIRLAGINAPEVRGDERAFGLASAEALKEKLSNLSKTERLLVKTQKNSRGEDSVGKYGRYLGVLLIEFDDAAKLFDVNKWMVSEGYAKWSDY